MYLAILGCLDPFYRVENRGSKIHSSGSIFWFFSPQPTKSEGTLGLHSVRPPVSQSGKSVFRTFFHAFRYLFDIWYIALPY
jgi:hypothetical protein